MIALAGAVGLLLALAQGTVLAPRLPEPPDGSELHKLPYSALPTVRRVAGLVAVTICAQAALLWLPDALRPIWFVYGSAGAALIWVDACTTWLPSKLALLASGQMLVAIAISSWRGGGLAPAVQMAGGALAATGFLWLFWRFSHGGIGFGDVRLAPLVGATAASLGIDAWFVAMLAGSVVGVVWGLVFARHHPAPGTKNGYAYGPALWVGPYAALIWTILTRQP